MTNGCDRKLAWRPKHTHGVTRLVARRIEVGNVLAAEQPFQKIFTLLLEV
jgi:hypothetical protein